MAQARTNPWLVNVVIPAMSAGLNTTLDQILWVLNAYILVYAVLLITAGRLGDLYGQRNLFAIGLFIFTAAYWIIPDLRPGRHHGWDVLGIILATAGLFAIVFGLIEGQRYSWGQIESYGITIPEVIGAGVVLIVLFLIWERFQTEPLLPLSLFEDRNF